jgi:hypothetical protein
VIMFWQKIIKGLSKILAYIQLNKQPLHFI